MLRKLWLVRALAWRRTRPALLHPRQLWNLACAALFLLSHGGVAALARRLEEERSGEDCLDSTPHRRAERPSAPDPGAWAALVERHRRSGVASAPVVDVIIPVYRGRDQTLACLYSVLVASVATLHAVIVIDDASPEPELVQELGHLAEQGLFQCIHNERNLGYVATVNQGMSLHPDRDVVLLNADTVVYGDWLDRLRATAYRDARVGSVSPFSNNAEICSYPVPRRANEMALEITWGELDRLAAATNAGLAVEVPTSLGFCMYLRRDCLADVGFFDVERFGRGYGEENDFCLRARKQGWRHLLAGDVFVYHQGAASFGEERRERIARALRVLRRRFPSYESEIGRFVSVDPIYPLRRRLDIARLRRRGSPAMLFVTHGWGGGVERHVQDMSRLLQGEGVAVFFLRPDPLRPHLVRLTHPDVPCVPSLRPFDIRTDLDSFVATLGELGIGHVHVHHCAGFDPAILDWIRLASARSSIRYDVTIHDYVAICPRIHLVDDSRVYCGEPAVDACERCIRRNGSPFGVVSVRRWRERYARFLRGARRVFVPNVDVRRRLERYFAHVYFTVRPHPEAETLVAGPVLPRVPRATDEPLRVAIIGAIGLHKGSELVYACASDALVRHLPLVFVVVGCANNERALRKLSNVRVTGRYAEDVVLRLLEAQRCHVAWFPSVSPETHCFTLSVALAAGLFPVAFDIGAVAERIRSLGWGHLLPVDLMASPAAVNDQLLALRPLSAPPEVVDHAWVPRYPSVYTHYYVLSGPPGVALRRAVHAHGVQPAASREPSGESGHAGDGRGR